MFLPFSVLTVGANAFCDSTVNETGGGESVWCIERNAFGNCKELTVITLSASLQYIEDSVFAESGLTDITIPAGVLYIYPGAFVGCPLQYIDVEADNAYYYSLGGALYERDTAVLLAYPIGSGAASFAIPDGTVNIADYAIYGNTLNILYVPSSVETLGWMSCSSCDLNNVVMLGSTVPAIYHTTFESMSDVRFYVRGNKVNSYKSDWSSYFLDDKIFAFPQAVFLFDGQEYDRCELPYGYAVSYIDPGYDNYRFEYWYLDVGDGTPYGFDTPLTGDIYLIAKAEFLYSEGLQFDLIASDTAYEVSLGSAYDTDLYIPDTYDGKPVTRVADYGFGWYDMDRVRLGDNITEIGAYAFCGCYCLQGIILPSGVTSIGESAFASCDIFSYIVSLSDVPPVLGEYAFADCDALTGVYVFAANLGTYGAAWPDYAGILFAMPVVIFETLGGSPVLPVEAVYASRIVLPENPIRDGFAFGGWFYEEECNNEFDADTVITEDLILYAKWI